MGDPHIEELKIYIEKEKNMKHKKIFISVLIIIIIVICFIGFKVLRKSNNKSNKFNNFAQMKQSMTSKNDNSEEKSSTTLSSSSEVKSALIENIELHATYYLKKVYVEANSYVAKGEKILKYTNGTYLTAPYDCYIVELKVPELKGKCLNSHYVKIQSKNMLTVSMNVSETKISKISIGQEAVITIPALEKEYKGYVTHIGSTASNGKFTIDIEFENDGDIKLGMTSTVQISI